MKSFFLIAFLAVNFQLTAGIVKTIPANAGVITINAGNDISLVLPSNSVSLNATANSTAGNINSYIWNKISGPALYSISNPGIINPVLSNLVEGTYTFELTVTDDSFNTASDTINIIVNSRILIDFGPTISSAPDVNGNYWNNIYAVNNGIKLSNAITTNNVQTNIGLVVSNRIDGSFGIQGTGLSAGNTVGNVGDYLSTATTDYAFADQSAVDAGWAITGLDSTRTYTIKFWGNKTATFPNVIEIKKQEDIVWQSYDASGNSDYNNAAVFVVTGKSVVDFNIRVQTGSAFGYICLIDILQTGSTLADNAQPIANAGNDIYLTSPINSTTLDATLSNDADGSISSYSWTTLSNPSQAVFSNASASITTLSNLSEGFHQFELTVTDNNGATATDTISVFVGSRVLIDFGPDQVINPDINNNYWNNVTTGTVGTKIADAINTLNASTGISLNIMSRIDGTFNTGGPGVNTGNTIGAINDYPASTTTDYAFAHPSTTNGLWKLTGLDSNRTYSVKFWGTKNILNSSRIIQIKTTEDTDWQQYDASNNSDYNNAAYFLFTGKSEIAFNIKVDDASSFGYISLMDIYYTNACIPTSSSQDATACNTYNWNGTDYTASGTYTFTTLNANGCDSVATLNLTITDALSVNAGLDQTIDPGTSAQLSGSIIGIANSTIWSGGNGSFSPDNTDLNAIYTPSADEVAAGIVVLTLTADGPCGIQLSSVTITISSTAPVSILHFTGYKNGKKNQLQWTTITELNNYGFEIQRSYNGIDFNKIGFVSSSAIGGNSNTNLNYQFADQSYFGTTQYYRLLQLDFDNHSKISNVVLIRNNNQESLSIDGIYPNPAVSKINVVANTLTQQNSTIVINDFSGKQILKQNKILNAGANIININVAGLSAGTYSISIISENKTIVSAKFVKL